MCRNCRCRKCCHKNYCNEQVIEDACEYAGVAAEYDNCDNYDNCSCGFEDEFNPFPENPMLAQSYVPWQVMDKTFVPNVGLRMGTIYPELVRPYMPGQSMAEIAYIEATNEIKEGCNKC